MKSLTRRSFILKGLVSGAAILVASKIPSPSTESGQLTVKMVGTKETSIPVPYNCEIDKITPDTTTLECNQSIVYIRDRIHKNDILTIKSPDLNSDIIIFVSKLKL